jgi:hypothetical protein
VEARYTGRLIGSDTAGAGPFDANAGVASARTNAMVKAACRMIVLRGVVSCHQCSYIPQFDLG